MTVSRLDMITVAKPWGRHRLWPGFADPSPADEAIGEIWFDAPARDLPLLVKYLFTSERLSIQVHPDDALARAQGQPHGKEECWIVLAAEPGATLGLGTHRELDDTTLRAAAIDGSIESLMDWKPVKAGDVVHVRPGTVHAIGAGITLIEVQQNIDLTYRLYDYGRPRPLHLEDGIPASQAKPFVSGSTPVALAPGRNAIVHGGHFTVERWHGAVDQTLAMPPAMAAWLIPVSGSGRIGGHSVRPGECWLIEGEARCVSDQPIDWLCAYPSSVPIATLVSRPEVSGMGSV